MGCKLSIDSDNYHVDWHLSLSALCFVEYEAEILYVMALLEPLHRIKFTCSMSKANELQYCAGYSNTIRSTK
jgi:hypothetical protein